MSVPDSLTGTCEGCGSPDGLFQPHMEMTYCPECATKNDLYSAAGQHLASLLAPTVKAWRRHWIARGVSADLLLEMVENSDELEDIVKVLNARE